MTASDPMDVDPPPGRSREEAPTSNLSPLPKDAPTPEMDEQHDSNASPSSKDRVVNDKSSSKDASVAFAPSSPESIQDEIVVNPRPKPDPQSKNKSASEESGTQIEPVTPSKLQRTKKITIKNAAASPTPTTQAKFELKDEEASTSNSRRNPKRTASKMAQLQPVNESSHDEILEDTLKPVEAKDVADWTGWAELESEPVRSPRSYEVAVSRSRS